MQKLTIGTRGSQLALWQAEHIKSELLSHHENLKVEIKIIKTTGDKILDVPLAKIGGKGLFTKEIEESMLKGEVDVAVHSLKDVPVEFPEGLVLSAITKRDDPRDCFISHKYASIQEMPQNAILGTTSLRRGMQARQIRPDLTIKSLRGNVQTRLRKLEEGEFDAILLATAGVNRLDIWDAAPHIAPVDVRQMVPAMGQAALGIEVRADSLAYELTQTLNDRQAVIESTIEREFVKALDGGCQVPIGVHASLNDQEQVHVNAIIGLPDGTEMLHEESTCPASEYATFGATFAEHFIKRGAKELLERAEGMAWKD